MSNNYSAADGYQTTDFGTGWEDGATTGSGGTITIEIDPNSALGRRMRGLPILAEGWERLSPDARSRRQDAFLSTVSAVRVSRAAPGEAVLRWGESPGYQDVKPPTGGFEVKKSDRNDRDQDGEGGDNDQPAYDFQERSRQTSDVTITNPDDPADYVVVRRVEAITFDGPALNGKGRASWRFTLNNDG